MTQDPKAPGAPAVYLAREEITDNFNHFVSSYARIKVLTDAGKDLATVEVSYRPGYQAKPILEGRTIHPDGTVYPLVISDQEFTSAQDKAVQLHKLVFNLPNVTVGSILEYRWTRPMTGIDLHFFERMGEAYKKEALASLGSSELAFEIPEWEVQTQLFTHKAHFYFNPLNDLQRNVIGNPITTWVDGERASYLLYTQRLPAGVQVGKSPKDDYTLDIKDVPSLPREDNSAPQSSLAFRVRFYYTPYNTAADYWTNEIRRWTKGLEEMAVPSDAIREAATQITNGATTAESKARKLYDAVQAMQNTDFTGPSPPQQRGKRPDAVLRDKSGSGNDLAALYLALVRAAGLQADGMAVASRDERLFDANFLSLEQLDALLVVLHLDGKDIYLDPGEKLCPFGQLHWTHAMAGGLQENAPTPRYTPQNQTKDAMTVHAADLIVDSGGGVTGTLQVAMNGPAALRFRQLNLRFDLAEVQRQIAASVQRILPAGMLVSVIGIKGLETAEGFLQVNAKVAGPLGTVTGKRIVLPAIVFSDPDQARFVSSISREWPVDLHYAEQLIDDVVYHVPAGFQVASAPQSSQLPWPEHATLVFKVSSTPNTVDVKHVFARAFVLLEAKEYPTLHEFYQKLATADQGQVVLAPAASAGN